MFHSDIQISVGDLRGIIREELVRDVLCEAHKQKKKKDESGRRYPDQFVTSKGKACPYGSDRHIGDLEDTMERLKTARSRQRRGTAGKTDMTRAISRLRTELHKAKRFAERQAK